MIIGIRIRDKLLCWNFHKQIWKMHTASIPRMNYWRQLTFVQRAIDLWAFFDTSWCHATQSATLMLINISYRNHIWPEVDIIGIIQYILHEVTVYVWNYSVELSREEFNHLRFIYKKCRTRQIESGAFAHMKVKFLRHIDCQVCTTRFLLYNDEQLIPLNYIPNKSDWYEIKFLMLVDDV